MDKDKLIEKLKEAKRILSQYKEPYNIYTGVGLNDSEIDLILTSLTAPVPDGKECFTQAEIAEMKEERYNTGYHVGYSEGKLNGYHPF